MLARLVVLDVGVFALVEADLAPEGTSTSDESGVVGRELVVLNDGRKRDVREGDGGNGVGGRL